MRIIKTRLAAPTQQFCAAKFCLPETRIELVMLFISLSKYGEKKTVGICHKLVLTKKISTGLTTVLSFGIMYNHTILSRFGQNIVNWYPFQASLYHTNTTIVDGSVVIVLNSAYCRRVQACVRSVNSCTVAH